ncbi:MAG: phage tail tape measure protein, partial [Pseudomonadota bacterium]
MARKKSLVIEILGNNKMGRAVRDAMGSLRRLGKFAAGVGRGIAKAFKFAAVGLTAFTAGLTYALREAARFNVAVARAAGMSGGAKVFKEMREEAMQLSAELGVARLELTKGFYEAGSRGIGRADQFEFVRQAAKLAVIDGGEVGEMVIGLTNLMNAYGKKAADARAITDMMMASVQQGGQNYAELAENISKAAPIAAPGAVGMDELLGAVAQITSQGSPAAEALTSLRSIIGAVNDQLGEGWGKTMDLQDALEMLAKWAGYSQTALKKMFGERHYGKVLQMVGKNAAGAAKRLNEVRHSSGAVEKSFGDIQKYRFWDRLGATLSVVATRFGIAVEEGADLADLIDRIAVRADEFGKKFADAALPYIQQIKAAIDDMLSGDETRIAQGKAAIEKMFSDAGAVVKPYFEQWGEAAGEAIWRG